MFLQPRTTVLILIFTALLGWVIYDQTQAPKPEVAARAPAAPAQPRGIAGAARPATLAQMPQRSPLGDMAGDPFTARSWQPQQPRAQGAPMGIMGSSAAAKQAAPVTPSLPFRFAGRLYQNGGIQTYLARGDDVFPVNVGDALQGGYRVESIGDEKVTLVYLPTQARQAVEMEPPLEAAEGGRQNMNRTAAMGLPGEQAR